MSKWKLILIMWSSWSGKWTLISKLKEKRKDFFYPISATTRAPREWEVDWETYYFLSSEEFKNKINNWEFLEYALVHHKAYYWLLKKPVFEAINSSRNVIREIDVQGFDFIKKQMNKDDLASIFILPPSEDILIRRIKERSDISDEELNNRLISLKKESEYSKYADYTIENIDYGQEKMFDDFVSKIELIVGS